MRGKVNKIKMFVGDEIISQQFSKTTPPTTAIQSMVNAINDNPNIPMIAAANHKTIMFGKFSLNLLKKEIKL